ncbi:MAG: tetratricopeptide repeat protein [Alphaproteobacteria bacterium]
MRIPSAFVFVLFVFFGSLPADAGEFEDAALAYRRGDFASAMKTWRQLADSGDARAQTNVGVMHYNGRGTLQDYAGAAKWYRRAAEQGNYDAQFNLGLLHVSGHGVPQDFTQAHKWFNLAAALSSPKLRNRAASMRDAVAAKMIPMQIAEAQKLAREWRAKPERIGAQVSQQMPGDPEHVIPLEPSGRFVPAPYDPFAKPPITAD